MPGQVIDGGWVSLMSTLKVHCAVFWLGSVAVQVTVDSPTGKEPPGVGVHVIVVGPHVSDAMGAAIGGLAPQESWVAEAVTLAGHVMVGGVVS